MKLSFYKIFFIFYSITALSLSQEIDSDIIEIENFILNNLFNINIECDPSSDIDDEIIRLIVKSEEINYYEGAARLHGQLFSRIVAKGQEDDLYEIQDDINSKLNKSSLYGVFDKWFYYKSLSILIKRFIEGPEVVRNDIILKQIRSR